MKNEQRSGETERKSATAATVCLHLNSRSFFLSLFIGCLETEELKEKRGKGGNRENPYL